jgi:hypothetical protein
MDNKRQVPFCIWFTLSPDNRAAVAAAKRLGSGLHWMLRALTSAIVHPVHEIMLELYIDSSVGQSAEN